MSEFSVDDTYNPADDAPPVPADDTVCLNCSARFDRHEKTAELISYTGAPERYADVYHCPDGSGVFVGPAEVIRDALGIAYEMGQVEGSHHKAWIIDQMVRTLTGAHYDAWVSDYESDGLYEWDPGIAP